MAVPRTLGRGLKLLGITVLLGCAAVSPQRAEPPQPVSDARLPTPVALPVPADGPELPRFSEPTFGPDILVIGDSQVSFGAGAEYLAVLGNLAQSCNANASQRDYLDNLSATSVAAIGVRSSSLEHWTAHEGTKKGVVCDKDQRFGVNAGAYGVKSSSRSFVQIGEERDYEFCRSGQTPLEAMFRQGYYRPKLAVLAFLGNSVDRWEDPAAARTDVENAVAALPPDTACVIMTTAPAFDAEVNAKRLKAQQNLAQAVAATGGRCSFARGLTERAVASATGNPDFFRTNDAGEVLDRFHPNAKGFAEFFEHVTPALCQAVFQQIGPR